MDLSDLRFRSMVKDGYSVTIREDHCKEVKVIKALLEKEGFEIKNIEDYPEREVFSALDRLAEKLLEIYSREQIFFLYTTPTPLYINKYGEYIDDDETMHQRYRNCRPEAIAKYNDYFLNRIQCNVIKFPRKEELTANADHLFGLFSLHYMDDVYRYYYWELMGRLEGKRDSDGAGNPFMCRIEKEIETSRDRNHYSDKLPDRLIKAVSRDDFCEYVKGLEKAYSSLIVLCVKDTIGFQVSQPMEKALHSLGLRAHFRKLHQTGYIAVISNGIVVEEVIGTEECKVVKSSGIFHGNTLQAESKPFKDGNCASIVWNGHDYAINKRGINFFVYDHHTNTVCDTRCYDTHSKECTLTKNHDFLDRNTALLISMEKVFGLLRER